jgi:lipopolysaccharide biosynthesis glycosyltransferase
MSIMNIALIYSPNWAEYVAAEVYSIFKHNVAPIKVYLISDSDGEIDTNSMLEYFGEGYETEFINAEELYNKRIPSTMNVSSRFTKYALYRLLLPHMIQDDKLIHIDADAIITGSIRELWDIDLDDNYMAGRIDIGADAYNLKRPIGLNENDTYVNAGVLLMNLKKIREDEIMDKWLYEVNNHKYAAGDQCIINKICKHKIIPMDNKFNVSISTGLNVLKEDIKIMHYAGEKCWNSNNVPYPQFWFRLIKEYRSLFGSLVKNG